MPENDERKWYIWACRASGIYDITINWQYPSDNIIVKYVVDDEDDYGSYWRYPLVFDFLHRQTWVLPGLQHRSWLQPGEDDEQLLFHPIAPTLTSSMTSTFSKFWSIYIDITPFLFPMSIDVSSQLQDWSTRLASMRIYNLSSGGKGFKVKSQNNNTKIKSQNNNTKIKSRSSWSRRWSDRGPAWVRSCSKPLIW